MKIKNLSSYNIQIENNTSVITYNSALLPIYLSYYKKDINNINNRKILYDEEIGLSTEKLTTEEFIIRNEFKKIEIEDKLIIIKMIIHDIMSKQKEKFYFIIDPSICLLENTFTDEYNYNILTYPLNDTYYNDKTNILKIPHFIHIER